MWIRCTDFDWSGLSFSGYVSDKIAEVRKSQDLEKGWVADAVTKVVAKRLSNVQAVK